MFAAAHLCRTHGDWLTSDGWTNRRQDPGHLRLGAHLETHEFKWKQVPHMPAEFLWRRLSRLNSVDHVAVTLSYLYSGVSVFRRLL